VTVIASLITSLGLDSSAFTTGLNDARKRLKATQKQFASIGQTLTGVGAAMTVGITAPLTAGAAAAVAGFQEQQQAMAQVQAALTSMGPVAGRTADQLSKAADAMELRSLYDAEVILKQVTAPLLTFGKVTGEVFDRAQQAAIDMAARLGGEPQAAAIMLGKALNDPVKGITALTRAGVSFSAEQVQTIKQLAATGQTAKAQGLILAEVEKQFRGAAAAAADAAPWRRAEVAMGQAADVVGEQLLPMIPPVATAVANLAQAFGSLPSGMQTTIIMGAAVAAALGPVVAGIGAIVTAVGAALPVLAALRAVMLTQAVPAIITFGVTMLPILAPLAAIAGAIALVVAAVRHWDEIKAVAGRVVSYVSSMVTQVGSWLGGKLKGILDGVLAPVRTVERAFFQLYDRVVGHSYVPDMVDEIGQNMRRLDVEMVNPARVATDAAAQAFASLRQRVAGIFQQLFPDQARVNDLQARLSDIDQAMAAKLIDPQTWAAARDRLIAELYKAQVAATAATATATSSPATLVGPVSANDPEQIAKDTEAAWKRVQSANDNARRNWAETARDIAGTLGGLVRNIRSGDWLDALSGVLDSVAQIGGIIGGGGQSATRTFPVGGFGGYRARGGPVLPNKSYIVGENGPEVLSMGRQGGHVIANDQIGAPMVVQLVVGEGQMFEPRVAAISGGVAVETTRSSGRSAARAQRQALG